MFRGSVGLGVLRRYIVLSEIEKKNPLNSIVLWYIQGNVSCRFYFGKLFMENITYNELYLFVKATSGIKFRNEFENDVQDKYQIKFDGKQER